MILTQDERGDWKVVVDSPGLSLARTHKPDQCWGRLCDIHNRRGEEPWASWPLNWREDEGYMEVICPHGTGHPTPAQVGYWLSHMQEPPGHGCDGCCAGAWAQILNQPLVMEDWYE